MSRRKRKRRLSRGAVFGMAAGALALSLLISAGRVNLEQEEVKAKQKYEAAIADYKTEKERETELADLKVYTQTKKFVEDMAREKFGLVYEDEIIFKPKSD